jgi:hypothetical protein
MTKSIPFYIKCTADWRAHRRFLLEHGQTPYLGRYVREVTMKQYDDPFPILTICTRVTTRLVRLHMQRVIKPSRPLPLP